MCCAVLAAAALLGIVRVCVEPRLPGRLPFYAAHAMSFKVNGNVLQRVAFRRLDQMLLYGSSELDLPIDNRPDAFFRNRPTGFAVFPVGRGGATCLMILQKLAGVGGAARGKKVVIILSSTWFLQPSVDVSSVGANLAGSQLSAWIFGGNLSPALKTDIARRLRDYADDLKDQPLNVEAVKLLARPTPWNRLLFAFLYPVGKLQNALLARLDDGVLLWEMIFPQRRFLEEDNLAPGAVPAAGESVDWDQLAARAEAAMGDAGSPPPAPRVAPGPADPDFIARLDASREFDDLTLLIRVVKELRMQVCFITQPFNGITSDAAGVSPRARRVCYDRLQAALRSTGYSAPDFTGCEEDRFFFSDEDHPSAKAWIFYDREIDRFYEEGKK